MFTYRSNVLVVFNQKGGVGKTTTVSILTEYGALIHKIKDGRKKRKTRVLVIDVDMQCNTSEYFVGMEPAPEEKGGQLPPKHPDWEGEEHINERSTIVDWFDENGKQLLPHTVSVGDDCTIDVIVGHPAEIEELNERYDRKSGDIDERIVNHLGYLVHDEAVAESYDLIIIDTGPSRSPIFRAALRAATHVIIPFEPEEKSLQGVNAMVQAVNSENMSRKRGQPQIDNIGLLPNKVRVGTKLHRECTQLVRDMLPKLALDDELYIPLATAIPARDVKGARPATIFHLGKREQARIKAEAVGKAVYERIFG